MLSLIFQTKTCKVSVIGIAGSELLFNAIAFVTPELSRTKNVDIDNVDIGYTEKDLSAQELLLNALRTTENLPKPSHLW